MNIVVLAGIPGTGSTTVLNEVLEQVDYVNINYGNVMFDIASEKGLVETRDDMRKLDPSIQKDVQKQAAEKIHEMAQDDNVIIDTHCTIKTPKGFLPGLPVWVLDQLQPNQFILVEAEPSEIIFRRLNDESRVRDVEYTDDIDLHQKMSRATAMAYAVQTGCTVAIVQNNDNGLEKAVSDIVDILS
ncbi:MAG: adenylate kinase [Methanosphaera sp.]|uniref:adenylate kinase n=1 Tax=Methanosphaera sp. TaxID=2666342 RepID=UPI0025D12349|nr:adenylate kinase [Methanosphaera sp.]MCI5866657.1 adenylate kinase [Methanosphaera sp.]MDD6535141.1 adenylate kinase [Methanosphaera sp.]MDY3955951.1 adenylate kinase [Methanosphaera sp.]